MSHEINVHQAQMSILRELLFHPSAGFAELQRPTGLESDHFKFHIGRLVELGYVEKIKAGSYKLSAKGKEYANKLDTDDSTIERQPKTAVLLFAVRGEGADLEVLVQQRLKNPFYGFYCRAGGKVRWGETIVDAAHRELEEETGYRAQTIDIRGIYHKIDYVRNTHELLEDKIFYVAWCTGLLGTLNEAFDGGKNMWMKPAEITKLGLKFEGVDKDHELYMQPTFRFDERLHFYDESEY